MNPVGAIANLFPLLLVIAIMYFLLIRPQKRRVQEHHRLTESVEPGDQIVTIGGLHGTVRSLGDDVIELEVAPGVNLQYAKSAIARRVTESLPSASTRSIAARSTAKDDDAPKTEELPAPKKTTAKKTTTRKSTAKKTAAKKSTAKKTAAKKSTARKSTAKKTTSRRS